MGIAISEQLLAAAPRLVLGVVEGEVVVTQRNEALWSLLQERGDRFVQAKRDTDLSSITEIAAVRAVYRQLGKDPARCRGAAESLLRRLRQGRGLYQVNNVVDVNNLVSIETKHPVGIYDVDRLAGPTSFRVGVTGETYQGIGKEAIDLEGLPVFADDDGPFGSPTSDSTRAMITERTSRVRMVIIGFSGGDSMGEYLRMAQEWLEEYANGAKMTVQQIGQ